jgi:hypothetical protein
MLFGWHELVDGMGWVSPLWALDLSDGRKPFLFYILGYRGRLGLMGFGPLTHFWGLGLGLRWTKKMKHSRNPMNR